MDKKLSEYFKKIGAKGGKSAAKQMSPEERAERARKAAATRWTKKGKNK